MICVNGLDEIVVIFCSNPRISLGGIAIAFHFSAIEWQCLNFFNLYHTDSKTKGYVFLNHFFSFTDLYTMSVYVYVCSISQIIRTYFVEKILFCIWYYFYSYIHARSAESVHLCRLSQWVNSL